MAKTAAIITAAGSGKRFGEPKLFAVINGKYFISIIMENLRNAGIQKIIAVVNAHSYKKASETAAGAEIIVNHEPEKGMISSVYEGIKKSEGYDGIMIVPVDHPLVTTETYKLLCSAFGQNPDKVIKPVHGNKSGHPVIVPFRIKDYITGSDTEGGLNTIIKNSGFEIMHIETNNGAVLKNINTAEDLTI